MLTLLDPETVSSSGGNKSQGLSNKPASGDGMSRRQHGKGIGRRCLVTDAGQRGLELLDGTAVPLDQLPSVILACREGQPLLRDSTKHGLQE
jgi:hypothetical protein